MILGTVARLPAGTPLAQERDTALAAVRSAGILCRSVRGFLTAAHTTLKPDRSPVTVADLGAEAVISLALADAFPNDPLMGEEDSRQLLGPAAVDLREAVVAAVSRARGRVSADDVARALDRCADSGGPDRRWWTLDPVDGTKGFLRDEQYAVALALVEDSEVVLGLLGCPNLATDPAVAGSAAGCVFVAERGQGAWQLPLEPGADEDAGAAVRIRVAPVSDASEARVAESVEAGHSARDVSAAIATRLGIGRPAVRLDSQAKYAVVARGEASIYLRIPHGAYRENVWDHAAGWVVVREAGGRISDVDGRPLDFTAGRRLERNRGIVATSSAIHERVLAAVRSALGG